MAKMIKKGNIFLNVSPLNLSANMGTVDTIPALNNKIKEYQSHLFNKRSKIQASLAYQFTNGNEAIKIPEAGIGIPLKPTDFEVSKLKRANRYAPAQGINKAGSKKAMDISNPPSVLA